MGVVYPDLETLFCIARANLKHVLESVFLSHACAVLLYLRVSSFQIIVSWVEAEDCGLLPSFQFVDAVRLWPEAMVSVLPIGVECRSCLPVWQAFLVARSN